MGTWTYYSDMRGYQYEEDMFQAVNICIDDDGIATCSVNGAMFESTETDDETPDTICLRIVNRLVPQWENIIEGNYTSRKEDNIVVDFVKKNKGKTKKESLII